MRKLFNVRLIDDVAFKKLRTYSRRKHCISNEINYDILSIDRYSEAFFFSNLDVAGEKTASDIVAQIIYLNADVHDEVVEQ